MGPHTVNCTGNLTAMLFEPLLRLKCRFIFGIQKQLVFSISALILVSNERLKTTKCVYNVLTGTFCNRALIS